MAEPAALAEPDAGAADGTADGLTGEALRALRLRLGLTQKELAVAMGVTDRTISEWELGIHPLRPYHVRALRDIEAHAAAVPAPKGFIRWGDPRRARLK